MPNKDISLLCLQSMKHLARFASKNLPLLITFFFPLLLWYVFKSRRRSGNIRYFVDINLVNCILGCVLKTSWAACTELSLKKKNLHHAMGYTQHLEERCYCTGPQNFWIFKTLKSLDHFGLAFLIWLLLLTSPSITYYCVARPLWIHGIPLSLNISQNAELVINRYCAQLIPSHWILIICLINSLFVLHSFCICFVWRCIMCVWYVPCCSSLVDIIFTNWVQKTASNSSK